MASGLEANSKHIARFAAKPYPQQQPADAVTPAFEACAYGKIVGQLRSDNAVIKAKAVVAAREMLCMPLKHIQCISAGITPALVELLAAPDESLQASAAATLQALVAKEVGCRDMLQHGGLPQLLQLLKQPSAAVKDAVYGALCAAARFEVLRTALMQEPNAMRQLLGHVQQEEPSRAAQALELLVHCTQVRHNHDALTNLIHLAHAVPKLAALISNSSAPEPVRLGATRLLASLMSTQDDGRTQAVEAGCVPVLLSLVTAASAGQACAAASALMMVSLSKQAKVALHEANAVPQLMRALAASCQQEQLQQLKPGGQQQEFIVNLLQTLANLAEHPQCRTQLQQAGAREMLQGLQEQTSSSLISKAAETAARMASFATWPGVCASS